MKILLITPAYPPYQGSHTQRMLALTDALVSAGIDVYVLTCEILSGHPGYNPKTLEMLDKRVTIFRSDYGYLHKRIYLKKENVLSSKEGKSNDKKNDEGKRTSKFFNTLKSKLLIPDSMVDWYFAAKIYIDKEKIIEKIQPDYVYSCSMPNTSHLIGYYVSKKYGIPQIMDYGDPWVYINGYSHGKLRFNFERWLEKKILFHSKLISFTTEGAEKLYCEKYSLDANKLVTAMTGYDEKMSFIDKISSEKSAQSFIVTYGGALQVGVRDPLPFIKAVDSLADQGLVFKLRTDNVQNIKELVLANTVNGNIEVEGYIPFDEYYQEMLNADALVFFGNSTSDQLPGKIFNYLPTRKPIIYVSNIEKGGSDQALGIVVEYGCYAFAENDEKSIIDAIKKVLEKVKNEEWKAEEKNIQKYSTQVQMKKIAERIINLGECE